MGDGRGMYITVAHFDLEVRSSGMVQCCTVYPSTRPDLWVRICGCFLVCVFIFLFFYFFFMRVDEVLNVFMC